MKHTIDDNLIAQWLDGHCPNDKSSDVERWISENPEFMALAAGVLQEAETDPGPPPDIRNQTLERIFAMK